MITPQEKIDIDAFMHQLVQDQIEAYQPREKFEMEEKSKEVEPVKEENK